MSSKILKAGVGYLRKNKPQFWHFLKMLSEMKYFDYFLIVFPGRDEAGFHLYDRL